MKNKIKTALILFAIFTILAACSDDSTSAAGGGGTETGNGIAIIDTVIRDSVIIRDSIVIRDSILTRDSLITKDSIVTKDSVITRDSVVTRDSVITRDSIVIIPDSTKDSAGLELSGVVQKGPFIAGSSVYVFELDDEKLLQTGKAFHGKISKNGQFKITNISLKSKYAILEATGFFFNEITGEESNSQITLRTIADISNKENVNINFLTQLSYDRIVYLVLHENKSIEEAKKQAESEIFKTFFSTDFSNNFENLDIFGSTEDDAKLLALSVLILSNKSDGNFSKTLAEFSEDIETDGSFDDEKAKLTFAENAAFYVDLDVVRKNIAKLTTGNIPNFEKAINDYWAFMFGLGECNTENEGEIKKNQNEKSAYSTTSFICKNKVWEPYYLNPDCEYGTFTDERDGNIYHTTKIGNQVWMAENLRFADNGFECQNGNKAYCKKYGYYYTYNQIECPAGWHLPSIDEWNELFDVAGGAEIAADSLRSAGGWNVNNHKSALTTKDPFCFSAIPAGVIPYGDEGNTAYYPSSNTLHKKDNPTPVASQNIVFTSSKDVRFSNMLFSVATPVRCVKDSEE